MHDRHRDLVSSQPLQCHGEVRTDRARCVRSVADRAVRLEERGSIDRVCFRERRLDTLEKRNDRVDLAAVERTAERETPRRHRSPRPAAVDRVVDDLRDLVGVSPALGVPVVDVLQGRLGVLPVDAVDDVVARTAACVEAVALRAQRRELLLALVDRLSGDCFLLPRQACRLVPPVRREP